MKPRLTIALLGKYFGWAGGVDFLRHVANCLLDTQGENDLSLFLLLPVDNKIENARDLARAVKESLARSLREKRPCLAKPRHAYHESMIDFFSQVQGAIEIVYYTNSEEGLLRALQRVGADAALPVIGTLGTHYPVPWVGYWPDFQHKYLPGNFQPRECFERDIGFAATLRDAAALIVTSKAVKDDVLRFYPYAEAKIMNLPFAPNPVPEWFLPYQGDIAAAYSLPERYFLISNQFWVHKDHMTAFRALRALGPDSEVCIVCTGGLEDYRRPDYLSELRGFLAEHDLARRVKILGHIPKRDQIEIMKGALALIQPTLFEGTPGGGCVYDAVSLGVPAIISDIPVNREVVADNIRFFAAGDSEDLALKMREVLTSEMIRPGKEALIKSGQANLHRAGRCLIEAVRHAQSMRVSG